jgi:hypothetical protein
MTPSLQLKNHRCQGKLQGDLYFILPSLTEPTHRSYIHEASTR